MRVFKLFILVVCLSYTWSASAQDMIRVRKEIKKLCSKSFAGRGYTKDGHLKAANFIKDALVEMGADPIGGSYFQEFTFPINTFPSKMSVSSNGEKLEPGVDFIIEATSASADLCAPVKLIDVKKLGDADYLDQILVDINKHVIVWDHADFSKLFMLPKPVIRALLNAKAWVAYADKLTQSMAPHQIPVPYLIISKDKMPKDNDEFCINCTAVLVEKMKSQNVIAKFIGTEHSDSCIVLTAHYDHLGQMGSKYYFPGANDNASGVAMMLELMRYFDQNPPKYSVVCMAFSGEEAGLIGSKYYTENPLFPLGQIKFLINLDLFGTGAKGMTVVNGTLHKTEFELLQKINKENNYLTTINARGEAANSDHYFFTKNMVPAFFMYLMGDFPHYHDVEDRAEDLPLGKFEASFKLIVDFIAALM